jgi:RNA-directed DNA polymerase
MRWTCGLRRSSSDAIRYADDFVCAFQEHEDATAFYTALGDRRGKFKLELTAEKTRIIVFPRSQTQPSFEFLGFEFRWGKDRRGKAHLRRRTSRKKLQRSPANFTKWCRKSRNLRLRPLFGRLNANLQGYTHYYGVKGNFRRLEGFDNRARHILIQWLNRRSQRRRLTWRGFNDLLVHFKGPRPRITERPRARAAASGASAFCGSESC